VFRQEEGTWEKRRTLPRNPSGAVYGPGRPTSKTRLRLVSQKRNQVTDDGDWLVQHATGLPVRMCPPALPEMFGPDTFVAGTYESPMAVGIYGSVSLSAGTAVVTFTPTEGGNDRAVQCFDFAKWVHSGKALWIYAAQLDEKALYVAASYPGYAHEVGGKTGYLAALDSSSGKLLWQAGPRIANTYNVAVGKDFLICGYGFTREPDFLFVLDKKTGRTLQKIAVKSGPEHIQIVEDRVFVRCYDTDYVFQQVV
jgi:hypothetical protein